MAAYSKPYLTVAQQLALLESRGLQITDAALAAAHLERLGYYRLSGYWYPLRKRVPGKNGKTNVLDEFQVGAEFSQAVNLYVFDKKLRLLMLDAIERVEVALRISVALRVGQFHPLVHRMPAYLDGKFARELNKHGRTAHELWLEKLDQYTERSKEDFVLSFKSKYPSCKLPIWMAIDLWDFGMMSRFLQGLKYKDRAAIAGKYGLLDPSVLISWARSINFVRNLCAHHQRLWNRVLIDIPRMPKVGDIAILDDIIKDNNALSKIYAVAAILRYLMIKVNPNSQWHERLKSHFETLPSAPGVYEGQTGFPQDWQGLPLWAELKRPAPALAANIDPIAT